MSVSLIQSILLGRNIAMLAILAENTSTTSMPPVMSRISSVLLPGSIVVYSLYSADNL
jgi:hypothetical protein